MTDTTSTTSTTSTTDTTAPALTFTGGDTTATASTDVITPEVEAAWRAFVAAVFTVAAHVAWLRVGYVMVRGDAGKGPRPAGLVLADGTPVGAPWVTVCVHGTVRTAVKGAAAEQAGRDRAAWCPSCASLAAPALPFLPGYATPVAAATEDTAPPATEDTPATPVATPRSRTRK